MPAMKQPGHGNRCGLRTYRRRFCVSGGLVIVLLLLLMFGGIWHNKLQRDQMTEYRQMADRVMTVRNESVDAVNKNATLLVSVWNNAIYRQENTVTDPYTRPDGVFVTGATSALGNLYSDPEFLADLDLIRRKQIELRKYRKHLLKPPKEAEAYNELILRVIDDHIEISMEILNPSGSYEEVYDRLQFLFADINEALMELAAYECSEYVDLESLQYRQQEHQRRLNNMQKQPTVYAVGCFAYRQTGKAVQFEFLSKTLIIKH